MNSVNFNIFVKLGNSNEQSRYWAFPVQKDTTNNSEKDCLWWIGVADLKAPGANM